MPPDTLAALLNAIKVFFICMVLMIVIGSIFDWTWMVKWGWVVSGLMAWASFNDPTDTEKEKEGFKAAMHRMRDQMKD